MVQSIVIQFDDISGIVMPKSSIRRSKQGCFNCRKRKRKCDMTKPGCSACDAKCIPCVWPKGNQRLPKDYQLPQPDPELIAIQAEKREMEGLEQRGEEENVIEVFSGDAFASLDSGLVTPYLSSYAVESLISTVWSSPQTLYNTLHINGFLHSSEPQHTHPQLRPTSIYRRLMELGNPIVDQVSFACGVSFLSWEDTSLKDVSTQSYKNTLNLVTKFLNSPEFSLERDEIWVSSVSQVLWICAKTVGITVDECTKNLNNSYKIIQMQLRKTGTDSSAKAALLGSSMNLKNYFDEGINNTHDLRMDIQNEILSSEQRAKFYAEKSRKLFIDSFIFNYSLCILFVSDIHSIPNPFQVFKDHRVCLRTAVFNCDAAWMNNPVLGASTDAFELLAKSSYLMRNLENPMTVTCAKTLFGIATYLPQPIIPPQIRMNSTQYHQLRNSTLAADCVTKATKILLRKIITPEIQESDPIIQEDVHNVIQKLRKMTRMSSCKSACVWSLFICGLACIASEDKEVILENCDIVGDLTHGAFMSSVVDALLIAWGDYTREDSKKEKFGHLQGKGMDVLYDVEFLATVIM